jgi:hypothetical protein
VSHTKIPESHLLAKATLRSGEIADLTLDFPEPFVVETFVAGSEDAEGVVVEEIYIGGRSLLASSRPLQLSMFREGRWPIKWQYPVVNVGEQLRVRVRNTAGGDRSLGLSVSGYRLVERAATKVGA